MDHPSQPLPGQAPVMVLPGAVLFPHALMPLYIFEPRYRAMLTHALEHDRVFCVALLNESAIEEENREPFHRTAGIGLVRACVGHEDGTSHLVLQGLARVDLRQMVQESPFPIAEIRELWPASSDPDEVAVLCSELRERCLAIPIPDKAIRQKLDEQLTQISDPSVLGDLVAHTFLKNSSSQQEVLQERNIANRLRIVLNHLADI